LISLRNYLNLVGGQTFKMIIGINLTIIPKDINDFAGAGEGFTQRIAVIGGEAATVRVLTHIRAEYDGSLPRPVMIRETKHGTY
tara:strand:+ start:241 stop:492 length:252 start_codon:yes stop_codon:yes gene_type:complete